MRHHHPCGKTFIGSDGNDVIYGTRGADRLIGKAGDDALHGGRGNDLFVMSPGQDGTYGNDLINGGAGYDTLDFRAAATDVFIDLAAGVAYSSAGVTTFASIERVIGSDATNDTIHGSDAANSLYGGRGDDELLGGAGNDIVRGGAGSDGVWGEAGNDRLEGGAGDDGIIGGAGNDTMYGGDGEDIFLLGTSTTGEPLFGADRINGGSGQDRVVVLSATVADLAAGTLVSAAGTASLSGIEMLFSGETIGDPIESHQFSGNGRANVLAGGSGDDRLSGRGGNDELVGLDGADRFVFEAAAGSANADSIVDFAPATDELVFENAVFRALGPAGEWTAGDARFHAAAGARSGQDADDRLVYDTASGELFYDADGSGAGDAQLVATLALAPALAASDIAVI